MNRIVNLWRAHCSQEHEWKLVKLDPYADRIAQMIKNIDPADEKDFPIFGQLLVDEENRVRFDLITPFSQSRPRGNYVYYWPMVELNGLLQYPQHQKRYQRMRVTQKKGE